MCCQTSHSTCLLNKSACSFFFFVVVVVVVVVGWGVVVVFLFPTKYSTKRFSVQEKTI